MKWPRRSGVEVANRPSAKRDQICGFLLAWYRSAVGRCKTVCKGLIFSIERALCSAPEARLRTTWLFPSRGAPARCSASSPAPCPPPTASNSPSAKAWCDTREFPPNPRSSPDDLEKMRKQTLDSPSLPHVAPDPVHRHHRRRDDGQGSPDPPHPIRQVRQGPPVPDVPQRSRRRDGLNRVLCPPRHAPRVLRRDVLRALPEPT